MLIEKGATFSKVITYKDSNGNAIDLTGYTARMHIRETVDSADTILELTTENSRITLGGVNGTITLSIADSDTTTITQKKAFYDLEIISSGGVVTRLIRGDITISNEVTR